MITIQKNIIPVAIFAFLVCTAVTRPALADSELPGSRHGQSATARKEILKESSDVSESSSTDKDSDTSRARLRSDTNVSDGKQMQAAESKPSVSPAKSVHGRHGRSTMARSSILQDE